MKIALVAPNDFSIWVFRKRLIKILKKGGHEVYAISEYGGYVPKLESLGVTHLPVKMGRFISPIQDLRLFFILYKLFRSRQFDIVHNFTIKPNIYGSLAAKAAGTKNIYASVTGLGFLSTNSLERGFKNRFSNNVLQIFYSAAAKSCTRIWFQNVDDLGFFVSHKLVPLQKAVLVRSSGVNLKEFSPSAVNSKQLEKLRKLLGDGGSTLFVSMVTRPLENKGVCEFIETSQILREKYPKVKFILVGGIEKNNPLSVSEDYLRRKQSVNFIWLGFREDIREIQALSDISVLPSYYPEGIPRNLLEAMAMGNPIVTTDHVGCREVVEFGENGYLVPIKDVDSLVKAIDDLLSNKEKRILFGQYSRRKAEREFDEKIVAERIITELYGIKID